MCLSVHLSVCSSKTKCVCLCVSLSVCPSETTLFTLTLRSEVTNDAAVIVYHTQMLSDIPLTVCLSMCLSVCLSICSSVCLSVCPSVCLFVRLRLTVCLSVCLSICSSVCLHVCLSVCPSVHLFVCLFDKSKIVSVCLCVSCPSVCPPVHLSVCLSICVCLCLSICPSVHPFLVMISVCLHHLSVHSITTYLTVLNTWSWITAYGLTQRRALISTSCRLHQLQTHSPPFSSHIAYSHAISPRGPLRHLTRD